VTEWTNVTFGDNYYQTAVPATGATYSNLGQAVLNADAPEYESLAEACRQCVAPAGCR
jgi:hypothetical protein